MSDTNIYEAQGEKLYTHHCSYLVKNSITVQQEMIIYIFGVKKRYPEGRGVIWDYEGHPCHWSKIVAF